MSTTTKGTDPVGSDHVGAGDATSTTARTGSWRTVDVVVRRHRHLRPVQPRRAVGVADDEPLPGARRRQAGGDVAAEVSGGAGDGDQRGGHGGLNRAGGRVLPGRPGASVGGAPHP